MARNEQRRQKKLAKKAAKKRHETRMAARTGPGELARRIARVSNVPVLHSYVGNTLWSDGIASVLLSRQLENRSVAFAAFLVDVFCLGVKDVNVEVVPYPIYRDRIYESLLTHGAHEVSPAYVRKLVEGAVEYAARLGLPPHPDYRIAREIFGEIDPQQCDQEFEFGKDGKPLYIAGPYEPLELQRTIMNILTTSCGKENVSGLLSLSSMGDIWFDEEEEEDCEEPENS